MRQETGNMEGQRQEWWRVAWSCHGVRVALLAMGVVVSGLLSPVCCLSAGAQELKIGYVNLAKVFDNYVKTKALDANLEKKGKQKESELEGRVNELKALRQGLELLSDEAREAKAREIEQKADDLQRFRNATARDLRRERDKIAKELLLEIQQGLEEYAKANGFSVILDSQSLLYGQGALDVTEDVLALLNGRGSGKASGQAR
jgi:outer membrane protein